MNLKNGNHQQFVGEVEDVRTVSESLHELTIKGTDPKFPNAKATIIRLLISGVSGWIAGKYKGEKRRFNFLKGTNQCIGHALLEEIAEGEEPAEEPVKDKSAKGKK